MKNKKVLLCVVLLIILIVAAYYTYQKTKLQRPAAAITTSAQTFDEFPQIPIYPTATFTEFRKEMVLGHIEYEMEWESRGYVKDMRTFYLSEMEKEGWQFIDMGVPAEVTEQLLQFANNTWKMDILLDKVLKSPIPMVDIIAHATPKEVK